MKKEYPLHTISSLRALFAQQSKKYLWITTPNKQHKSRNDGTLNLILYKIIALFALILCSATYAQSGIYITGETGYSQQGNTPNLASTMAQSSSQSHLPIGRLSIGYLHDFNDWLGFGFETGAGWYQGTTYDFPNKKVNAYSNTMEFLTITTLHQQTWDFFVKLGGIRHTLNNFSILHNEASDSSETKIQPEVGAGINYHFNSHFALTSQYLHSFGSQSGCPSLNIGLIGLRIAFW